MVAHPALKRSAVLTTCIVTQSVGHIYRTECVAKKVNPNTAVVYADADNGIGALIRPDTCFAAAAAYNIPFRRWAR